MKRFNGVCIVTQDVRRLRDFYQNVLQELAEGDDTFVVFSIQGSKLSLCSAHQVEEMAASSTTDTGYGNCVLEFEVDDVDQEYGRLKQLAVTFAKPPTTQPWGIRSVWFRDADGNLVNFYAPVTLSEKDRK
jgi:catechol 2,3-dioxygenase-like lactoylglutathione lyase family enzyme